MKRLFHFSPKSFAAGLFFAAVAGYAAYELTGLVRKPELIINNPPAGATLHDELITVRGQAAGLIKLTINDEPLALAEDGVFETKLLLAHGYNIIRFSGADRFGRTIKQALPIIYQSDTLAYGEKNEGS